MREVSEVSEAPEALEVMRRVLLCMLEAAEGELCLLEVLEVPEVMRCVQVLWTYALSVGFCCAVSKFPFLVRIWSATERANR